MLKKLFTLPIIHYKLLNILFLYNSKRVAILLVVILFFHFGCARRPIGNEEQEKPSKNNERKIIINKPFEPEEFIENNISKYNFSSNYFVRKIRNLGYEINSNKQEFLPIIYNDTLYYRRTEKLSPLTFIQLYIPIENIPNPPNEIPLINNVFDNNTSIESSLPHTEPSTPTMQKFNTGKLNHISFPQEFDENVNSNYNDMHPAYSPDGSFLVFVSDRPGGINNPDGSNNTDLYITFKKRDGTWKTPKNLGKRINTPANEFAPFIDDEFNLFFSSNGYVRDSVKLVFSASNIENPAKQRDIFKRKDTVNYDIIKAEFASRGRWDNPKVLSFPINTEFDEIGYTKNDDQEIFASNRPDGITSHLDEVQGNHNSSDVIDDFDLFGYVKCYPLLFDGIILISNSGYSFPLNGEIIFKNETDEVFATANVDVFGKFKAFLPYNEMIKIYYNNFCSNDTIYIDEKVFYCDNYRIQKINLKLDVTFESISDIFPKEDLPLFTLGYYKPITKKNMMNLRRKFSQGIYGTSLSTQYIFNPDLTSTNYDKYISSVDDEINKMVRFIKNNAENLRNHVCLNAETPIFVTITGFGDLYQIYPNSKYIDQPISSPMFESSLRTGTTITRSDIARLRAYYITKEIISRLSNSIYMLGIKFKLESYTDLTWVPRYKTFLGKYNGKIEIRIDI